MYSNVYGTGGRTKRGKMVIAHFNPQELNGLDHLQGKTERCPRTGMRSYSHLEEILKNPHLLRGLMHHVHEAVEKKRQRHAEGGHLHDYKDERLNKMADSGIRGDTELGLIGPHTKNVLDHLIAVQGYPVDTNPETGKPHYGFLDGIIGGLGNVLSKIPVVGGLASSLLGGAGNAVKSALPSIMPGMGQLAQKYLPQLGAKLGGQTGSNLANMASQFIGQATQQGATPEQIARGQQWADQASQLGNQAYGAYQKGGFEGMGREMGGGALSHLGQYVGGAPGEMMGQAAQGIRSGQGMRELTQGVRDRFSEGPSMDWGNIANRGGQYLGQGLQGLARGESMANMARQVGGGALREATGHFGGDIGKYGDQFGRGIQQGGYLPDLARQVGNRAYNDYMPERPY